MSKEKKSIDKKIVVSGDFSINRLEVHPSHSEKPQHFRRIRPESFPRIHHIRRIGGAPLISKFLRQALPSEVLSQNTEHIESNLSNDYFESHLTLRKYPFDFPPGKESVFRIHELRGYSGPDSGKNDPLPIHNDNADADIVVLYNESGEFQQDPEVWPQALNKEKTPHVIMSMPLPKNANILWETIRKYHLDRTVLLLDADDLRAGGVKISRRLSWERTAKDLVWQLAANPELQDYTRCFALIIRFGLEAVVIHSPQRGKERFTLLFDPVSGEDEFIENFPGGMLGTEEAFTAALAASLSENGFSCLSDSARCGLAAARRLHRMGFGSEKQEADYPVQGIFLPDNEDSASVAKVIIPIPTAAEPADPDYWRILDDLCLKGIEEVAYNFVREGKDPALKQVPVGQFRFLRTYDRAEIESFRSIKNLIGEYLESPGIGRPLSIAVFGAPGSGKSFGVTEVAESVAPGRIKKLEFNLSQFNSPDDLVVAFHRVRDMALSGKVPIVFFDEFDSAFDGRLGWLKYFLAPMQDGQFRDGDTIHPIGRAIFVFAGGTCVTFSEFRQPKRSDEFKEAKGTDFVSRLRGYVNIKGPNPVDEKDRFFTIRRAIFLRFLLQKNAKNIFDAKKRCRIDQGILRAMIKVPIYKHGVRSMQAVIEMSLLSGRESFEQAALPAPEQLGLHVDEQIFMKLVVRDILLGSAREILARAIHEKYREENIKERSPDDYAMKEWENLNPDLKESNFRQADHIPVKLKAVGCDFIPVSGREPVLFTFTADEIEVMAKLEHERFVTERLLQGWVPGPRDDKKKTSPYLVKWEDLPLPAEGKKDIREYDRDFARAISGLLSKAGFEIYKLKQ